MPTSLTRFCVEGLHGRRNQDVPIHRNKLVIVGENGTGKSTLANLIYFFLTRQWGRLREYRFAAITAVLGGEEIRVTREDIDILGSRKRTAGSARVSLNLRKAFYRYAAENQLEELLHSPRALEEFAFEYGVSPRMAIDIVHQLLDESGRGSQQLTETTQRLGALVTDQVLYLPTYRRIEQDLRSIFRGVEMEAQLREFRQRLSTSRQDSPHIELVEFGMEDVEKTILDRMNQLKESLRNGLNELTGKYLRDVIRGVHTSISDASLGDVHPHTFEAMLARIDEAVLPARDKATLRSRIQEIVDRRTARSDDKVVLHFLSMLLKLQNTQLENERDVRAFVDVCNEYLVGKELVYDNMNFTITIRHAPDSWETASGRGDPSEQITLKMLSSGEKQIVSLFSHIYLSGRASFFMVIDEPELSLSVPWQRRFLPDILRTEKCNGLVAVTHSPFIWDNELEPYVHSLMEYTEPVHVIR